VTAETESYPLQEMLNELAGICSLYFGVSVLSVASFFHLLLQNVDRINLNKTDASTVDFEACIKYVIKS
jgi:hypothetical protein